MPRGLAIDEQRLWDEVIGSMPEGLWSEADTWIIEKFVIQCCFARRCTREIESRGMVIQGPNGMLQKNPLIASRQSALSSMQAAADTLGLTPAARNRLTAPTKEDEQPPIDLFGTMAPMTSPSNPSAQ